jgi:hypothetical protein
MADSATWQLVDHVIEMPDGTRFRGRGLRRPLPGGEQPDWALHLLGSEPPPAPWPARWVAWPDFRLPRHAPDAADACREAHRRASTERVEVACGGGRGRTGTALACIAILAGVAPRDAVAYVRRHYDRHAVETPFQRRFVRHTFPSLLCRPPHA